MKRIRNAWILLLLFISASVLAACKGDDVLIVSKDTSIMEMVADAGDHDSFITFLSTATDFNEIKEYVDIRYLKDVDGAYYSSVVKTNQQYVLLGFNRDKKLLDYQLFSILPLAAKEKLLKLQVGSALTEVREIDPENDYSFLYHSWSGYPRVSSHIFEDGTVRAFTYSEQMKIEKIYDSVL